LISRHVKPGCGHAFALFPDKFTVTAGCPASSLVGPPIAYEAAAAPASLDLPGQTRHAMTKHGTVLVIENEADDIVLIKRAFAEAQVLQPVHVVTNYKDAVGFLSGDGTYANRAAFPFPFLILLNLKMPNEEGFAVLRWLYERPGLRKRFSVVVMNPGGPDQDVQLAYELGAQSYLLKPLEHKELVATVRRVKEYWVELNLLPDEHG
jgi:CheY-like chemotaxis protein